MKATMAWNEPGKGQDPWGGNNGNRGNGSGGGGGGPPDLDEIWRRLKQRFGGGGRGSSGGGPGVGAPDPKLLLIAIPVIAAIWLATGLYIVQPGEQGVVLRFGDLQTTTGPGWHWHMPYPIATVIRVDVEQVRSVQNSAVMLTKDENIVDVRVAVQYRVFDPGNFLFNVRAPDETVEQALKSAVREIVGTSRMNQVIQEGVKVSELEQQALDNVDLKERKVEPESVDALSDIEQELVDRIQDQQDSYPEITNRSRAMLPQNIESILQSMLDEYESGMRVLAVNVQYSQPPEPVQGAFEEAIKAREEEERKKNLARAYARDIVARAEGEAASVLLEAQGYREQKVARAQGETVRFTALLDEYTRAPAITRQRLYLESMGDVLSGSNLIITGGDQSSPLLYMPLQEMLKGKPNKGKSSEISSDNPPPMIDTSSSNNSSSGSTVGDPLRSRER
ncbi:protease modulator HflK [Salinisphaera sp. P385]|uniref:Protease modulator HflK n=1 Tax=Spectribacter acetivorans TaxID=3075603 RepID=A0ABU3B5M9_9GAMM|nr:protease modulator HflK [Salinisphaera sp. P385]MDT0617767.1 protease modulator HflK [Salinisphaera sp. P385]